MISSILGLIGGALTVAGQWLTGYANPKTTEARRINDENEKLDKLHDALEKEDVDAVRRELPFK